MSVVVVETLDDLRILVAGWTFPGWTFYVRESGALARNQGVPTIAFESRMSTLQNAQITPRAPGRLTNFSMEARVKLPSRVTEIQLIGLDLVKWTMMHEAAEFFQEDGRPVFDPHDTLLESAIYAAPAIPWQPGE